MREDHGANWAAEGFAGSGGNNVRVRERRCVYACKNESGFMGNIGHVVGTDFVGDFTHAFMIDFSWIGSASGNDYFRFYLESSFFYDIIVEDSALEIDVVVVTFKDFSGEGNGFAGIGEFPAVRKVAAVIKKHSHNAVAGF